MQAISLLLANLALSHTPTLSRVRSIDVVTMERQYSGLTIIGSTVLAFNSALAIYNSWGDAASVAFVLVVDAALLLLFLCLVKLERARAGGTRGRLMAAVWALTTVLTAMFAPLVVATVVWLMATAATAYGFWAFFLN